MKPQRPLLGFSLALLTAMMWGSVPIAAQKVLSVVNAQTLVWARFIVAAIGLLLILGFTKKLPKLAAFTPRFLWLIGLGVVGLSLNFFLFSYGLNFISPTTSQVLWQLAPFTMILCGVVIFKEQFGRHQQIGLLLLIIGLIAFFNERFGEIFQFGTYAFGVLVGAGAAVVWVVYAIAQKMMLAKFSSQQILLIIYAGCALVLTPFASRINIDGFDPFLLGCFIFCCLNTLIGYGAYAEALNHWDASKVSVVTILVPIFTMVFSSLGHWAFPDTFASPDMNLLSYIGAFIVVSGTILSAVGYKLVKRK